MGRGAGEVSGSKMTLALVTNWRENGEEGKEGGMCKEVKKGYNAK